MNAEQKPYAGNPHVRFDEGPLARASCTAGWGLLDRLRGSSTSKLAQSLQFEAERYSSEEASFCSMASRWAFTWGSRCRNASTRRTALMTVV